MDFVTNSSSSSFIISKKDCINISLLKKFIRGEIRKYIKTGNFCGFKYKMKFIFDFLFNKIGYKVLEVSKLSDKEILEEFNNQFWDGDSPISCPLESIFYNTLEQLSNGHYEYMKSYLNKKEIAYVEKFHTHIMNEYTYNDSCRLCHFNKKIKRILKKVKAFINTKRNCIYYIDEVKSGDFWIITNENALPQEVVEAIQKKYKNVVYSHLG